MSLGSSSLPLRVAVVGGGPSGFYVSDALFKSSCECQVDVFEKLPFPYGLLRGGIAPDHQKMKSVASFYERVAMKNIEKFSFFGNVSVGDHGILSLEELKDFYDVIVFSYGAEGDKKTGLPGEHLNCCYSARDFVGWYNAHLEYVNHKFDLSHKVVAIIGQGNVAVDVARILAKTRNELANSDISKDALNCLDQSNVTDIHVIGRRGPVQAAFTSLEIAELGELEDCDLVINPDHLILDSASQDELAQNLKAQKNYEVLHRLVKKSTGSKRRRIHLHFFLNPLSISGKTDVEGLVLDKVTLSGSNLKSLGEQVTIPATLIFRSVGYKGLPIDSSIPFDTKKNIIPNDKGRICTTSGDKVSGMYVAGWIKRGPSGVLGTNKPDATETVASILEDLSSLKPCKVRDSEAMTNYLKNKNVRVVTFLDWKKLNEEELLRGSSVGKVREKLISMDEVLSILDPLGD